jgi:hypothetical protein
MRAKKLADIEALKQLKLITDELLNKKDDSLPESIASVKGSDILYRNLRKNLNIDEPSYIKAILDLYSILKQNARVDWWKNHEMKRVMRNSVDDYLYDELKVHRGIDITTQQIESLIEDVMKLAENNHEMF